MTTQTLTLTDFLLQRIAEDEAEARADRADAMVGWRWKHYPRDAYEEIQAATLARTGRVLAECEAKRRIVALHESWPVMVEQPLTMNVSADPLDSMTFRASQQIAWLTTQEYRRRFGDDPPSAPIVAALAAVYADHPSFQEAWRA